MRTKQHQIWSLTVLSLDASAFLSQTSRAQPDGFELAVVSSPPAGFAATTLTDSPVSLSRTGRTISDGVNARAYLFDERSGLTSQLGLQGSDSTSYVWDVVISGTGLIVAHTLTTTEPAEPLTQIVLTDRTTGSQQPLTQLLDRAADSISSWSPALSTDGRFLNFISDATDLVRQSCQWHLCGGTSTSVTLQMAADATATFAVFVRAAEAVTFDPVRSRVSVSFLDSTGVNRGRTSLALR